MSSVASFWAAGAFAGAGSVAGFFPCASTGRQSNAVLASTRSASVFFIRSPSVRLTRSHRAHRVPVMVFGGAPAPPVPRPLRLGLAPPHLDLPTELVLAGVVRMARIALPLSIGEGTEYSGIVNAGVHHGHLRGQTIGELRTAVACKSAHVTARVSRLPRDVDVH